MLSQMSGANSAQTTVSIVEQIKRQGVFDDFRKACLADLEDNQQYKELVARVESFVNGFLANINPDDPRTNKHHVREQLRSKLTSQDFYHRSLNNIIQQLISQPKIDSDLVPEVELATYRHLGLNPPDRLLGASDVVDETQKSIDPRDAPAEEEQLVIEEGAELSVQFELFDDMNVQNMDIDSDPEPVSAVHSPMPVPPADELHAEESKSEEQSDQLVARQTPSTPTMDDNKDSVSPVTEVPLEPTAPTSKETKTLLSIEEREKDDEKDDEQPDEPEPFVDPVMEALQPISPDSSSNSRPDDGSDEVDLPEHQPIVNQDSPSCSLAEHLQPISPESEDRPEPAKRRGRPTKRKSEESARKSAPSADSREDAESGRRKRPTRNRRPTDPDFVYY